jgi:hypothetical protein
MSAVKVKFIVERETKGTYVFREVNEAGRPRPQYGDPDTVIGALYVRKSSLPPHPNKLTITLEAE